jgi:hypothetical protein
MSKYTMTRGRNRKPLSAQLCNGNAPSLLILLLAGTILLSACGGGTSSGAQQSGTLSGNWQFSMTNPDPNYPANTLYGLQGGFLLQSNGSVSGQAVYLISGVSQTNGAWAICDSGSVQLTGTVTGQTFNLTAAAGSQTFALQGTLSNGQISNATFSAPGGTVTGFTSCGMAASGQVWSATSVPPLTGSITGSFHSGGVGAPEAEANQDFPVTGFLTQGKNVGASNATVTGSLSFINQATGISDYPCIPGGVVSVNGQISGNTVILELIGTNGSNAGQIGIAPSQANLGGNGTAPVTLNSTTNGLALQSSGVGYVVNTSACGGSSADTGYVCLGLSGSACQQPITLTPAILSFPAQLLGSTSPATQTITLTSNQPSSAAPLSNLSLTWLTANSSSSDTGQTDFTNIPNFSEVDTCAPGGESVPPGGTGSPFSLSPAQSCTITISFAPQASCTWLPGLYGGTSPAQCPLPLAAQVIVNNVTSTVDNNPTFAVPINGTGSSFIQPSVPEIDFGAEAFGEASLPQLLTLTNTGATPVQILPPAVCPLPTTGGEQPLTHPLIYPPAPPTPEFPVVAAGLQVVGTLLEDVNQSTISYNCDFDPTTMLPNFQISSNTCSGALLTPQQACSLEIAFVPQSPKTYFSAPDYFLQLNTVQCADPVNDPPSPSNPCELDGGRLPVELKANMSSPLRMVPGAGLDFGNVSVGKSSVTQSVTLLNDPTLTPSQTVNFVGKIAVSGNYSESDDCPFSLASGASCTLSVTFKPSGVGHNPGTLIINYIAGNVGGSQTVYLRGTGQ